MLENFCSPEEVEEMKTQMLQIVEQMDLSTHPKTVFTTTTAKQVNLCGTRSLGRY